MKKSLNKILHSRMGLFWLLLVLAAINFLSASFHARVDLTREKRYTLSPATRALADALEEDIHIDVFLKGDFPAGFRKLANSTEEFLQLLKDRNGARVHYRFISPQDEMEGVAGRSYEDTLVAMGATPINLTVQVKAGQENKRVYPVALVKYRGRQELVNLYSGGKRLISPVEMNSAEALMEYQFARTLDRITRDEKPLVGYSVGNGEPLVGSRNVGGMPQYADPRTAHLEQILRTDYQLFTLNLHQQPFIPDTFNVLIIVKPELQFTEDEKLKIDQYLMRGGRLLLFIDDLIAEQDSLRFQPEIIAYDRNLNLTDLLFRYGARVNPNLVMDLQCDFMPFMVGGDAGNPQFEFLHWNYYPLFESKGNHTINRNIGLVAGRFVNSVDTITVPGIAKTPLLSSSANSRIISTPALISLNENRNTPEDEKFKQNNIPVAWLLEGRFTSLYRNRVSRAQADTLSAFGVPFRESSEETKIIVVGDGDMVLNDFSPNDGPLPMGMNFYTAGSQYEYQFANREFLQNCMEYLVNNPAIIETRNKDIVLRLLDSKKVSELKSTWQLINIALPVLLVILAGWVYQQVRRKKYAGG